MRLTINIDGGSRGNPGPAASAFIIKAANGSVMAARGLFIGEATNNVAEYKALTAALKAAAELGATELSVISDSELLVRQMSGLYRVRNEGLIPLFEEAGLMAASFKKISFIHVRREENTAADALVNRALNIKRNVEE